MDVNKGKHVGNNNNIMIFTIIIIENNIFNTTYNVINRNDG